MAKIVSTDTLTGETAVEDAVVPVTCPGDLPPLQSGDPPLLPPVSCPGGRATAPQLPPREAAMTWDEVARMAAWFSLAIAFLQLAVWLGVTP